MDESVLNKLTDDQKRKYLIAKKTKRQKDMEECFDPNNILSRANAKQEAILSDTTTLYKFVRCGNQCLAKGTLVMTPLGPKAIEQIQAGMHVYDEYGNEIVVKDTFYNGVKEVRKITNRQITLAEATDNHVFLTRSRVGAPQEEINVGEFARDTSIKRVEVDCELGAKDIPTAYALGAMLGDGCCTEDTSTSIVISSSNDLIPSKVAQLTGASIRKLHPNNYSYKLSDGSDIELYNTTCLGNKAHQKYLPLDVIKTWNRQSLLKLVAGLIDTDGSVGVDKWNSLTISLSMQAESVIEAVKYAFMALWQTPVTITVDDREKYVNGPVYEIKVANNAYSKRIVFELDSEIVTPNKKWKASYSDLVAKRTNSDWVGAKVSKDTRIVETYDIHVDSETNLYLLANGLVTHNSGKTATISRDYAWKMSETHPYWRRRDGSECPRCKTKTPKLINPMTKTYRCSDEECNYSWVSWENDRLTFLVLLQSGQHITDIWETRIAPFFRPDEVKVSRDGNMIKHVTHKKTGNRMIFFSHDNATEVRKRIQYFAAHDAWIDEMPGHYKVYEELQRRVDAKQGQFVATLTPKVTNVGVKNFVDKMDPALSKLFRMTKLDNPIYQGREKEELAKIAHLPEAEQRAILYGDWMFAGELRLNINENQIRPLPDDYTKDWHHLVAMDPASAGKAGLVVFAKDPIDIDTWWVVKAKNVKGDAPSTMVKKIVPEEVEGLNIVKRVVDPHEAWFVKEAAKAGEEWLSPFDKTHRRKELIGGGEEALINPKFLFAEGKCDQLIEELNTAEDNPADPGTIKNSTKYHSIDAWLYGLDLLPVYEMPPKPLTERQAFRKAYIEERNAKPATQPEVVPNGLVTKIQKTNKKKANIWNRNSVRWQRRR